MLANMRLKFLWMIGAVLLVAGCGDSDSSFNPGLASVRVLHGVADAPLVNVYLDDEQVLSDVDFRVGSGYLPVTAGTYDVRVEAIVPGGNVDVISVAGVEFARDTATTVIAAGDASENTITPLPVAETTEAISAGNLRLRVTHASPEAPPVYLALTTPDLPIDQAALLGPLAYTETTDALEVPAGSYQVRVTAQPQPLTDADVLFDSGELALPAGADLHVVAVTSTVPSQSDTPSPISLVALDGEGSADLFDADTGADLRVVHNSPGAPAVDVFVDLNDTAVDEDLQIVSDLSFGEFAGYLQPAVAPVSYGVSVRLAEGGAEALAFDADLMPGLAYTVIANDVVANISEWILVDDNRRVATEAKVRLVHGSPSAGVVDIYVLPPGVVPSDPSADPVFSGVSFGQETGFVGLVPDTYDVFVTAAGGTVPAISATGLSVSAGGVYTAIARDPTDGVNLGLILLDDFAL